jgi:hypothetical protein
MMNIGQRSQAAALQRSLERRQTELSMTTSFARKLSRAAARRARSLDRLAERAGIEQYPVQPIVLAHFKKLRDQIQSRVPRSQRDLLRLTRPEAKALLHYITRLIRYQRRLAYLIAKEQTARRQIMSRLRAAEGVMPLLHSGNWDELEALLARRRGKAGKNRHAWMLGKLRAAKRPYSREFMKQISDLAAEKRMAAVRARWERVKQEGISYGNRDRGTAG